MQTLHSRLCSRFPKHRPSRPASSVSRGWIPLALCAGWATLACDASTSKSDPIAADAGPEAGALASQSPLFSATPILSSQVSTSTSASASASAALPDAYEGPTAENPIVACEDAIGSGSEPLIDDFEDGDLNTLAADGRNAGWYFYDDESSGTRAEGIRADSLGEREGNVLTVSGADFNEWGSGFGAGMRWDTAQCWYNAEHYRGIDFWARGTGSVRVTLQNPKVRPVAMGGACADNATCFDSHGVNLKLAPTWTHYRLPFKDFEQAGWGTDAGEFLPSAVYILEFQFGAVAPYEMWLDDISFLTESSSPSDAGINDASASDAGTDAAPASSIDSSAPDAAHHSNGDSSVTDSAAPVAIDAEISDSATQSFADATSDADASPSTDP